ncbi:hypothetical protein BK816_02865 [Boudabousia tangfeifanii]|uniref:DUF2505 domain-containing protein n=1 Tax=Boudabousia tangfeifanii TaxID=1912795 RepID=A0A1D9MJL6_9ACTO|nr:DUF2505 domain-containing protein [Boudabousia tangfeifanii]AOZ72370.1 hypothetical protein BK816_02865 [Boudabousia tangfeifanii]
MQFEFSYLYPKPLAAVRDMYCDKEFRKLRVGGRDLFRELEAHAEGDQIVVTSTVDMRDDFLPSGIADKVKRFVAKGASATIVEKVSEIQDGKVPVAVDIQTSGVPLKVNAQLLLSEAPEGQTKATWSGDFQVTIPLIGRTIERKVLEQTKRVERIELNAAKKYFQTH